MSIQKPDTIEDWAPLLSKRSVTTGQRLLP